MEELKRVLALDETYDEAGAHRVIGRIYFEAPSWPISVGDKQKSLQHLTTAVRLAPENSTNHLYLAETLLDHGEEGPGPRRTREGFAGRPARPHPQDLEEDRQEARRLLQEMKTGK